MGHKSRNQIIYPLGEYCGWWWNDHAGPDPELDPMYWQELNDMAGLPEGAD